jgi:predicted GIY-YIG superfamily endonuclease
MKEINTLAKCRDTATFINLYHKNKLLHPFEVTRISGAYKWENHLSQMRRSQKYGYARSARRGTRRAARSAGDAATGF